MRYSIKQAVLGEVSIYEKDQMPKYPKPLEYAYYYSKNDDREFDLVLHGNLLNSKDNVIFEFKIICNCLLNTNYQFNEQEFILFKTQMYDLASEAFGRLRKKDKLFDSYFLFRDIKLTPPNY